MGRDSTRKWISLEKVVNVCTISFDYEITVMTILVVLTLIPGGLFTIGFAFDIYCFIACLTNTGIRDLILCNGCQNEIYGGRNSTIRGDCS